MHLSEFRNIAPAVYLSKFSFVEVLFTFKNWKIAPRCIERFESKAVLKRLYLRIRLRARDFYEVIVDESEA